MTFLCNSYAQYLALKSIQLYQYVVCRDLFQICITYIGIYDFFDLNKQKIHHLYTHNQTNFSFRNVRGDL